MISPRRTDAGKLGQVHRQVWAIEQARTRAYSAAVNLAAQAVQAVRDLLAPLWRALVRLGRQLARILHRRQERPSIPRTICRCGLPIPGGGHTESCVGAVPVQPGARIEATGLWQVIAPGTDYVRTARTGDLVTAVDEVRLVLARRAAGQLRQPYLVIFDEVSQLCDRAGLPRDEWQRQVLRSSFAEHYLGGGGVSHAGGGGAGGSNGSPAGGGGGGAGGDSTFRAGGGVVLPGGVVLHGGGGAAGGHRERLLTDDAAAVAHQALIERAERALADSEMLLQPPGEQPDDGAFRSGGHDPGRPHP